MAVSTQRCLSLIGNTDSADVRCGVARLDKRLVASPMHVSTEVINSYESCSCHLQTADEGAFAGSNARKGAYKVASP